MTKKNIKLKVKGLEVGFIKMQQEDFICITDIAKHKNPDAPRDIIKNWMRSKNTIELLGLWEKLHNPDFKQVEFDLFRNEAGYNHFVLSPQKWISTTTAVTPKIAEQNDFFDIEFYRPRTITDDYEQLADDRPAENKSFATDYDQLSIEEKKLLFHLLNNEKITRKEGVDLLNLGETKVKEILNELLNKKQIERKGQGRSTFYTLVKMEGKK